MQYVAPAMSIQVHLPGLFPDGFSGRRLGAILLPVSGGVAL